MSAQFDPLWVPLIAHYTPDGLIDAPRTKAHLSALDPHVRQYLISGTTGDGWSMPEPELFAWLDVCSAALGPRHTFLVGAFAPDTDAVVARAQWIEAHLASLPVVANFAGLTVCAPIEEDASQRRIADHFSAILAATTSAIAVYELPQITQCRIAPETFRALAADPRVILCKDTSGADAIASADLGIDHVRYLRGAEFDYARHLKPSGNYDGWLLSTANGFAAQLRAIAQASAAGDIVKAQSIASRLDRLVEPIFEAAGELGGNAFADANRAVDHHAAHGNRWETADARRHDGSLLPRDFLRRVRGILVGGDGRYETGYL